MPLFRRPARCPPSETSFGRLPVGAWFSALALLVAGPLLGGGYLLLLDYPSGPQFPHLSAFPLPSSGDIGNTIPLLGTLALLKEVDDLLPDKLLLLAPIVIGGTGVYHFVRSQLEVGSLAAVYGGTLFVVNPFVYDRYLAGHLFFLLAYSLLPWALSTAVRDDAPAVRARSRRRGSLVLCSRGDRLACPRHLRSACDHRGDLRRLSVSPRVRRSCDRHRGGRLRVLAPSIAVHRSRRGDRSGGSRRLRLTPGRVCDSSHASRDGRLLEGRVHRPGRAGPRSLPPARADPRPGRSRRRGATRVRSPAQVRARPFHRRGSRSCPGGGRGLSPHRGRLPVGVRARPIHGHLPRAAEVSCPRDPGVCDLRSCRARRSPSALEAEPVARRSRRRRLPSSASRSSSPTDTQCSGASPDR